MAQMHVYQYRERTKDCSEKRERKMKILVPGKTMFSLLTLVLVILAYSVFIETADQRSHYFFFPLLNATAKPCGRPEPPSPPLKVYMYDLPRRFNVGMLGRRSSDEASPAVTRRSLPPWPVDSGLGRQHSVEYWMMASLLSEGDDDPTREAVRVSDRDSADVFFVPFFSALSFNRHGRNMTDPATEIDRQLQTLERMKSEKSCRICEVKVERREGRCFSLECS